MGRMDFMLDVGCRLNEPDDTQLLRERSKVLRQPALLNLHASTEAIGQWVPL